MTGKNDLVELVTAAAERAVIATSTAQSMMMVEILMLMLRKGMIETDDLRTMLDRLDAAAKRTERDAPMVAERLTDLTLVLRHAFDLVPGNRMN
ncbi:MAG: hypothetical protein K2X44_02100 [Magnetospirillum sp.]|nr:hypothetical protein [Magnetospirillum sp.]